MSPFWLSLWVASIALVIVILSGLAACYWMNRCKWGGIAIIDALITLPLVLPPVVVGFALLMVFTPGYAFGAWLEAHGMSVVFAASGAVIASSVIAFPLFYQTVRSALQSVDHNMEDVARTLGASELRRLCRFWCRHSLFCYCISTVLSNSTFCIAVRRS
ncbi:MAG: Molybdate ABC transporter, permease protein [Veillonella sp. DORA_A_3_16_22]|nr:MAG: Molybdate ABC transporter, permease protein [Veillonella sp. DORA_A_3_16_22]